MGVDIQDRDTILKKIVYIIFFGGGRWVYELEWGINVEMGGQMPR